MYAFVMDVPMPVEFYEQVHAELEAMAHGPVPVGCLLHLATRTASGFRVTEVWESHEQCDRFGDEVVRPLIERLAGTRPVPDAPPPSEELDLLRVAVPGPVPV